MNSTTKFCLKVVFWPMLIGVYALAVFMLAASFALAQTPAEGCAPHDQMSQSLAAKYGELVMIYARSEDKVVEFYVSQEGTWTTVVTDATGMSCMVADGDAWTGDRPDPEPQSGPAMYRILPGRPWGL